ncbi:MAG: glycoside hydrolase family 32 protein, partial [Leadbetterella sp.]
MYKEKFRPQYHFSPPKNWMNDPNGMVYYEGEYHLFYQYYPDGILWGPMHWGHAISNDMIYWKNHPIALFPDSLGYIFSGSAFIDWKNSSGLGQKSKPPMIAIYTYHDMEGEKAGKVDYQSQGIAYSLDKGRTWQKHQGNPVLKSPGIKDFRDPKVFWHEGTQSWIMALAVKDKISFYSSKDIFHWKFESSFNPPWAAYGGVWECPDLFLLKTEKGTEKWVLLVSINPGGPHGGSSTQYFVGNFDGKTFVTESTEVKWVDLGADNYAGVTWSDIPHSDGRKLFIGWASNWLYGQDVPTETWRSSMTIPRVLALKQMNNSEILVSTPIQELEKLRKSTLISRSSQVKLPSDQIEIELDVVKEDFELVFSNAQDETVILKKSGDRIQFDRSKSGLTAFNKDFKNLHHSPTRGIKIRKIRIFVDKSS